MQYALALLEAGDEIQRWPIDADEFIIGRSGSANVVIDGSTISRQHVRLWIEDGIVAAEDLGSRNGIKINGVKTRSGSLRQGDSMEIGNHSFLVTAADGPPVSLANGAAPEQAPNPEARAVQKRSLEEPDKRLNAALAYAARLQPYLFDQDTMFKHIARIILSDVPAQRCYILAKNPSGGRLVAMFNAGRNGSTDGPALNTTIIDHVFREKRPVIVGDVSAVKTTTPDSDGQPGVIGVPLMSNRTSIGVLYVDSGWNPSRFVSSNLEDMKAYGLAFGSIVGQALEMEKKLERAEAKGVVQATVALGKSLYEQLHDIREAAAGEHPNTFEHAMLRSDQAVQQMIAFGSLQHTSRRPLDINPVIEKELAELKPELEARSIQARFDSHSRAIVFGDSHQLDRMLYSFLITGINLSDAGSFITVNTESKTDGCHVTIQLEGVNSPIAALDDSSESPVQNASLGMNGVLLAYAHAVARYHGGKVDIQTEPGSGTTIHIVLPQQERAASTPVA